MVGVCDPESGVLKRGHTAAGQETGCGILTSHSSIQRNRLVESFSQPLHLHGDNFLPPGGLRDSQDIWEMRKERTLALAKALRVVPIGPVDQIV